jgi:hypothetical protein
LEQANAVLLTKEAKQTAVAAGDEKTTNAAPPLVLVLLQLRTNLLLQLRTRLLQLRTRLLLVLMRLQQ